MHLSLRSLAVASLLITPVLAQTAGVSTPLSYGCPNVCHSQNDPVNSFIARSLPNEYCHAVQIPNAATVCGFSFYFETVSGTEATIQAAFYRESSPGAGTPDPNPVGNATIRVDGPLGWYTAVLDAPVAVAAGELFWISADTNAVRPPDDSAGASTPAPSFWRRPPFGGSAWSQTGIINSPIYRIHCCGAGGVVNHTSNVPVSGQNLDLQVTAAVAGGPNYFMFGLTDINTDLGPAGAPGCALLTEDIVVIGPMMTDPNGSATFSLMIPTDPAIIGSNLRTQVLSGTRANPLGFVTTNSIDLTVGG